MKLRDAGEFGMIDRIAKLLPNSPSVIEGIGDDCAVVRMSDRVLLVTCDQSIENVHFRTSHMSPENIGWKAAASAISDIAAMGGVPRFSLVSLACPELTTVSFVEAMYEGMAAVMTQAGAVIVGGDTARTQDTIYIDVTVIGEPVANRYLRRKGAHPGDLLVVTGHLGESAAGLHALEQGQSVPELVHIHCHPKPRVSEGQWLCMQRGVHAMIDISDGLFQDAQHLARDARLGLDISPDRLPLSEALAQYCQERSLNPIDFMLSGGEDYELAFAADPNTADKMLGEFDSEFRTKTTVVGKFTDEWSGVRVAGHETDLHGFDHFKG